jgi:HSP20 family protein
MVLMRTDPFRELDRLAQQVFGTMARPATMPMDAYQKGQEFWVHFDLPGVDADSIELNVERNVLTVKAERRNPLGEDKDAEWLVAERPYGVFSRQLFLGETLDVDKIEASYDAGVLSLRIPVTEQAKARKIEIARGETAKQISA